MTLTSPAASKVTLNNVVCSCRFRAQVCQGKGLEASLASLSSSLLHVLMHLCFLCCMTRHHQRSGSYSTVYYLIGLESRCLCSGSRGFCQGVEPAGLVSGGAGEDLPPSSFRVLAGLGSWGSRTSTPVFLMAVVQGLCAGSCPVSPLSYSGQLSCPHDPLTSPSSPSASSREDSAVIRLT